MSKFNFTSPFVNYLKVNLNLNDDQEAIALYGLQVFTYTFVDFILVILAGWILGCLPATLAVVLTASCLRGVSGGAHSNSPLICALLGMIVSPVLGMLAIKLESLLSFSRLYLLVALGALISGYLIWWLGPVDSPAKPISSDQERRKFRHLSLWVFSLILLVQLFLLSRTGTGSIVLAISFGLWWQTFSLTKSGKVFATLLDNLCTRRGGEKI